MNIAIGNDHRGLALKAALTGHLTAAGHDVHDAGCHGADAADYPDHAIAVAERVATGRAEVGILICGSGIGMSIAANKVAGVRASLCHDREAAATTRQHNASNVLCLSGDRTGSDDACAIADAYLAAAFEGGRHARRVDKITGYEAQHHKSRG